MDWFRRVLGLGTSDRPRLALALGGGGVTGGMYEVGVLTALEERVEAPLGFDLYVGCSAGSVVSSLLANGVMAREIFQAVDQDLDDPLNFRRGAVYDPDAFRRAAARFARILWAVGRNAVAGWRSSIPDMLAHAEGQLPAGLFSLGALERFMRETFAARGLPNRFTEVPRALLIPAIDLDRAERVVFGGADLREVPVSDAIAASSAIPGFFEPYRIQGRDYVDGGVGFTGHADLAAAAGARAVMVVNPLVPSPDGNGGPSLRARGLYTILEQTGRIYSHNLLHLGIAALRARHPRTAFFVIQPERGATPLFGPSMGFEASRAALRYGYHSMKAWLDAEGEGLIRRLAPSLRDAM